MALGAYGAAVLTVMTLNIWNMSGPWRERRAEIVTWLRRLRPDLVCLQEVIDDGAGRNQARWLAEAAGEYHVAFGGAPLPGGAGAFGNAVLSRWPIEAEQTLDLHHEPRADDIQRVVLHARTNRIDVFSVHLNWRFDDGHVRERQVVELAGFVGAQSDGTAPMPPIVAGDFNADPDSNEIRYLCGLAAVDGRSAYFHEAWRLAGGAGPGWTWDNRNPCAAAEGEPDRRIDYVFSGWRPNQPAGRPEACRVVCDRALTGTFASDHLGLLATLADPSH